jgi:hypothetical protein
MRAENIGPRERRKRAITGVLGLLVGLGAFVSLLALGAPRVWRLGLLLPFWFGALGWFQAQSHT